MITACVSGRFSLFVPSRSTRYGIASRRKPSTPMSSQKRMVLKIALQHLGVVEVEIGLVAEESVPVVLLREIVPGPVRFLGVGENDPRAGIALRVVAPDVVVALVGAFGARRAAWNHGC